MPNALSSQKHSVRDLLSHIDGANIAGGRIMHCIYHQKGWHLREACLIEWPLGIVDRSWPTSTGSKDLVELYSSTDVRIEGVTDTLQLLELCEAKREIIGVETIEIRAGDRDVWVLSVVLGCGER